MESLNRITTLQPHELTLENLYNNYLIRPEIDLMKFQTITQSHRSNPQSPSSLNILLHLHLLLMSIPTALLLFITNVLISSRNSLPHLLHRLRISRNDTAIPPDFILFMFDIPRRPLRGNGIFVSEDEDLRREARGSQRSGLIRCGVRIHRGRKALTSWFSRNIRSMSSRVRSEVSG